MAIGNALMLEPLAPQARVIILRAINPIQFFGSAHMFGG
jgi:hypothetical protein